MPGALQANAPRLAFVNAEGSMWQYGTMRVADGCCVTNPSEALASDTSPSVALLSAVVALALARYWPALPITATALTPLRSSVRWFQFARFHKSGLPGMSDAPWGRETMLSAKLAATNEPKFGVAISTSLPTRVFAGGATLPPGCSPAR